MTAQAHQPECRILANLADNHNGNPNLVKQLIDLAASSRCDGVVLPHRRAKTGYTKDALLQPVADGSHELVTRGDLLQKLEFPLDALKELRNSCLGRMSFVGAPYGLDALTDLEQCEPDAYQVEPPVLGHLPLLAAIAETGRPVYLVAGRCTEDDVAAAVGMFTQKYQAGSVTLLHSVYAPSVSLESTALWFIPLLQQKFGLPIGYMGLDPDIHDAVAAFAMGAKTIEKMFTSDRFLPGPSHASSLDRDQLRELVTVVRGLEQSLAGSPPRVVMQTELGNAEEPQACLVAAYDLPAGESLGEPMLSVKLASDGIHPKFAKSLMGRRLAYDVLTDSPLTFGFIEA